MLLCDVGSTTSESGVLGQEQQWLVGGCLPTMALYYFDLKNGLPVRDRQGHECTNDEQAIRYSVFIARQIGNERPETVGKSYYISVVNEGGAEIHREPITAAPHTDVDIVH